MCIRYCECMCRKIGKQKTKKSMVKINGAKTYIFNCWQLSFGMCDLGLSFLNNSSK